MNMIPFENVIPWTYGTLIMWWIMAIWCGLFSSLTGVILNKGWSAYVITALTGMAFYWLITWIFLGTPIWHIAEKLNQTL